MTTTEKTARAVQLIERAPVETGRLLDTMHQATQTARKIESQWAALRRMGAAREDHAAELDRKSTRLNSSH